MISSVCRKLQVYPLVVAKMWVKCHAMYCLLIMPLFPQATVFFSYYSVGGNFIKGNLFWRLHSSV